MKSFGTGFRGKREGGTPAPLKELRLLNVVVFHPDDDDGRELIAQLRRIGCQVRAHWPVPERVPSDADIVFLCVRPDTQQLNIPWLGRSGSPPIIPVIAYENPLIIEVLLRLNVYCVIPSPVKSFGVMAALAVTISQSQRTRSREKYVKRLEEKRAVVRSIQKAKMIIMETRGMTEEEAYDVIRAQAMAKREPIERIAEAVLTAHEMYGPIRVG